MCYFINIGLEKDIAKRVLEKLPKDVSCFSSDNINFNKVLPPNFISNYIVLDMCSCALYSLNEEDNYTEIESKIIRKYKRKGWSKEKIERALSSKKKSKTNNHFKHGLRQELLDWILGIRKDFNTKVYLHIRFYNGNQNEEKFSLNKKLEVNINNLYSDFLFPVDTLICIN